MRVTGLALGMALLVAGVSILSPDGHAVLFKSTADPAYNTNAPGGALTNSGWQYEGTLSIGYMGTPIAPTFFLAAKHINIPIGTLLLLNGFYYHTITNFSDPSSDLQIWKVAETFAQYAPLYTNSDEVGKPCVVFGRGFRQRGAAVLVSGITNGWEWGANDSAGVTRWGENDVGSIQAFTGGAGVQLRCPFDRNAGSNECHLSEGDSSGAMFIQDGSGTWRLAGIHYAVDGPFSTDGTTNTQFDAALLDRGGLYQLSGTNWVFVPDTTQDNPSGFYSTRVSAHIAWINSVIDFEPGDDLRISAVQKAGNDVQIRFPTTANRGYRIDWRSGVTSGAWATLTNGVAGTGGTVTVTDVGAATLPGRVYRLGLVP